MRILLLFSIFAALIIGDGLARLDPNPPQGIDCDWCRYWQSLGETL